MNRLTNKIFSGIAALALVGCSAGIIKNGKDDSSKDYTLVKDGNYPGAVVFAYENEPENYQDKNLSFEILKEGCLNSLSVQEWFSREATKYGKQINLPLTLFPEDVKIPSSCINPNDAYQLDLDKFSEHLRENYPELKNYDFIAIYYKASSPDIGKNGYARKDLAVFCLKSNEKFTIFKFPHEFLHLVDAKDKYNSENDCDPRDIMKTTHTTLDDEVLISEQTAREIGWK